MDATDDLPIPTPTTGHPLVDAALNDLAALSSLPAAQQLERLAQAQEVLAGVLEHRHEGAQTTLPGTGMPRPGAPRPR